MPDQSTTGRGYGWAHQQARRQALAALHDGAPCPRCGRPMWRVQAKLLDLDHTDDRAGYHGLAHRGCNRRAGQARSAQVQRRRTRDTSVTRSTTTRSRNW